MNKDTKQRFDIDPKKLLSCHLCNVAKMTVIPAKAGIQEIARQLWIPAFAGMTLVVFYFLSHQTLDT